MAGKFDNRFVKWAKGTGFSLGKAENKTTTWGQLKRLLSKPRVTPETRKEFNKLDKDEQDKLKSANGWISGAQCRNNHRSTANILPRDLLTIDIDYAPDSILTSVEFGLTGVCDFEAFWHSSRRHTPEEPRIRLFMPMAREVDMDEYVAIVRFVAWMLDPEMNLVDKVSFRPAQMMFLPTCSVDDLPNFFSFEQSGKLLDPDAILADFTKRFGDWRDWTNWPRHPDEHDFRQRATRAEDPRQKVGPVGVFCRAFTITEAMEEFIPGFYIPTDTFEGSNPRYTYKNATSSGGAVIYDDDLFLYSHHGSDPLCDMNVNAFDMVRIHLFGDEDVGLKKDTPPGKTPSFKAMVQSVKRNKRYKAQAREEAMPEAGDMFSDVEEEEFDDDFDYVGGFDDIEPDMEAGAAEEDDDFDYVGSIDPEPEKGAPKRPEPSSKRKYKKNWKTVVDLELDNQDAIASTLPNVSLILQHDARLLNLIRLNEFTNKIVQAETFKPAIPTALDWKLADKLSGDPWTDEHDGVVRLILETPSDSGGYGMKVTDRDLQAGLRVSATSNRFHPVRDYLLGLKWDGKKRVDSLLIDFIGAPDTTYHREMARMMLVGSVTRVFEPGHKFDFACILQGAQGTRKSSFVRSLYSPKWFGEIKCDLNDQQRVAETLQGVWGGELPELASLSRADALVAKAFMRSQDDNVRMAYARHVSQLPRQAVFWGTTNEDVYLKDPSGNRSWWPVRVNVAQIDTDRLAAERDQLWAEAFEIYWQMRSDLPAEKGELRFDLSPEAKAESEIKQNEARAREVFEEWFDHLMDWLDAPITLRQFREEMGIPQSSSFDGQPDSALVVRCVFSEEQAVRLALGRNNGVLQDQASLLHFNKLRPMVLRAGWDVHRNGDKISKRRIGGGAPRAWRYRPGITKEEEAEGYRFFSPDVDEDNLI